MEGRKLLLHLGRIADRDTTWINGVKLGGMDWPDWWRDYKIKSNLLKPGRNVIAVRVANGGGPGGFIGKPEELFLQIERDSISPPLSLAGDWFYQKSIPLDIVKTIPKMPGRGMAIDCGTLYNGMIYSLMPFALKGVVWYQGEYNASNAMRYRTLLPALIRNWRDGFSCGEFPFLIVQLANYQPPKAPPGSSQWAELRESQWITSKTFPGTGLATAIDVGDENDIHPKNKQEVGRRLALTSLSKFYGKNLEYSGPEFNGMEKDGAKLRLKFDCIGGGLVAKEGKLIGFEIAGNDGKFVQADAQLDGNSVIVSSPDLPEPTAARYAWADNPACSLYNKEGLPALPFRTEMPK